MKRLYEDGIMLGNGSEVELGVYAPFGNYWQASRKRPEGLSRDRYGREEVKADAACVLCVV